MVKNTTIILLILSVTFAKSQRLNFGIDAGMFAKSENKTLFDNSQEYYLYATPYSEYDDHQSNTYNQVRLIKINGIYSKQNGRVYFGGNINYKSKNRFSAKLSFNFYTAKDELFYTSQNLMINTDEDENYFTLDRDHYHYRDGSIIISKYINSFSLSASYIVINKYKYKPYVLAGFTERITMYSSYTSKNKEYISPASGDWPIVQNTIKLQDDLLREFNNDGFKHYINLGLGFRGHSFDITFTWHKTMLVKSVYYKSQQYFSVNLSYDIVSIPLFD